VPGLSLCPSATLGNLEAQERSKIKSWSRIAYIPTSFSLRGEALLGMDEKDVQLRVLHACLRKVFEGHEKFCGPKGVKTRDCNGLECLAVCRLLCYISDLMERYKLASVPQHVS